MHGRQDLQVRDSGRGGGESFSYLYPPELTKRKSASDGRTMLWAQPNLERPCEVHIDPLYLFHCGLRWNRQSDTGAGWELIHGLRRGDHEARSVAAACLASTQNGRLLVRDLRRFRSEARDFREA